MAATADITGLTRETDCKTSNSLKQFLKQINATILSWLFFVSPLCASCARIKSHNFLQFRQMRGTPELDHAALNALPVIEKLFLRIEADPGFACFGTTLATIAELDDDSIRAARILTQTILRDACLTAQLMRHANASGRAGQSVSTVDQAVAILGINKVKSLAASLATFDATGGLVTDAQGELLQAEAIAAAFCGVLAAGLTRSNAPRLKPQESHLCGLLQNLGRMLAIYYLHEEVERSHVLQAAQNLTEEDAVLQSLGMGFDAMGAAVALHWKFPDVLQRSLEAGSDKIPARALAGPLEWHQYCAAFARHVTDALFRKPEHQMKGAVAGDVHAFRTVLHLKDGEVAELIERSMADLEETLQATAAVCTIARARELLRKSSDRVTDWLSPQDSLTKSSPTDARKTRVEQIYQTLRTIHDAFQFDMTLLCVPNGATELVAISGVGRKANQIISRFRCGGAKQDLFRSVSAKAIGLYVADVEGGPYAKFIPHWYANLVGAQSLYVMSLMEDGVPLGVVYGDFSSRREVPPDGLDGAQMRQWRDDLIAALQPISGKKA